MPALNPTDILDRHERIAFQFSGGKDSAAALFALADFWPQMTVYWLNSGDSFPETEQFVLDVAARLPNFVEVSGLVNETIERFGPPSDLISADSSGAAWAAGIGRSAPLQDRAQCCIRSKMLPLHARMLDDGITLIVRGQKESDEYKGPHKSGDVAESGIEFYYPIEHWTDADVFKWMQENEIPMPPLYEHGILRSGDCMTCSAWLGDRRAEYLRDRHPEAFTVYLNRIASICCAVDVKVAALFGEMEKLHLLRGE